ncbi:MAG: hydrogenase/urease maturation nickel metallochaperone HypA [Nanoarchaeota archaeon]
MHETVIATRIINEAKKHGKVKAITVEVGDLAHLPLNEMKECLQQLVDWKVDISPKRATVMCVCGYYGEPKILEKMHGYTYYVCPSCGNVPGVIEGEDIILKSVEVD